MALSTARPSRRICWWTTTTTPLPTRRPSPSPRTSTPPPRRRPSSRPSGASPGSRCASLPQSKKVLTNANRPDDLNPPPAEAPAEFETK
eukprot:1148863-Prorocentrum_minimum.AAC.4